MQIVICANSTSGWKCTRGTVQIVSSDLQLNARTGRTSGQIIVAASCGWIG